MFDIYPKWVAKYVEYKIKIFTPDFTNLINLEEIRNRKIEITLRCSIFIETVARKKHEINIYEFHPFGKDIIQNVARNNKIKIFTLVFTNLGWKVRP